MTPTTANKSTPTKPPSAHRLIATAELLEQILLNLSNQTLLLSQRVNTQFKSTIAGSLHLQRKLFFRLAPKDGATVYDDEGINPLVHKVPNLTFTTLNGKRGPKLKITYTFACDYRSTPQRPPHVDSSWRRMYLTHLPVDQNPGHMFFGREEEHTKMIINGKYSDGKVYQVCKEEVPIAPVVMGEYEETAWRHFRRHAECDAAIVARLVESLGMMSTADLESDA
ncbi:hypothetical protein M409DRAFT_55386 [Zasmidium cellare ATCC 36951]|uniref:F-box domain-containing protein n=1 Tax=Zasmidium cellare ATCC 36951 TaxID=1080233 RepID=A0A6A6CIL8_ZASCE|nr:uncharacterized protein M409DRAFT_55386 [Zasmidium cellare ATCC 36951]KAF2166040.1 hypothetical protein M409DRAFT_55386 [Zasmidium cellare ATCC 36951]